MQGQHVSTRNYFSVLSTAGIRTLKNKEGQYSIQLRARLCHSAGGELEQIQFLLGHRSVETTERYLGSRQRIVHAVNDKLGIEPDAPPG